ncbi:MAG: M20 family metallopeptidase [Victivallaceae bacterium]|nr:M20 family metallopeptidase [Victivallaceae bacterium]MDD3117015.1 M20 family metallopeptidase [Victivallaceae bacterium]MDD3702905.1 M20 family metallopeptidase [Victivallaceae bacterium]MDD5662858.1 M20 family metallopeptidase [Victivallaceae bacterium]
MDIEESVRIYAAEIKKISDNIHNNPELGFEEHRACVLQTEYLREKGFIVSTPYGSLNTAFRAEYGQGDLAFAIISEYDALPSGHACGHNLICAAALAAGVAAQNFLKDNHISGRIVIIGTPAEETHGGKIIMLNHGAFTDINALIICHPHSVYALDPGDLAASRFDIEFTGKAAHAAAAPSSGINALDAVNLLFAGVACWRQQLPPGGMVHGIITHGGDAPNIIPERTKAFFYLRSRDNQIQKELETRFANIAQGAALMTGTELKFNKLPNSYSADKMNQPLRDSVFMTMHQLGMNPLEKYESPISTDYANVSCQVPGVNFFFNIMEDCPAALHSEGFKNAAATDFGFEAAMKAAVVMAKTAIRFLDDAEFRQQVIAAHGKTQ